MAQEIFGARLSGMEDEKFHVSKSFGGGATKLSVEIRILLFL
jgi:hypothetical protein